ncbi:L-2,4-diaminobutyric acid acetyltransferase [Sneathiella chinensis]|uniref:L-2,4-diaminobutyric acid acetyltransferase n=2 Tax=Sneathiella chinensis TaxID=349750 RepID=A0ABQ5U2F0_9PROT|nr:L-2,4-diaminobutyric acid acetyltransferase [Sneathiella chinensis]
MIARCKPLDENSLYCNLLQCSHFAETCALARIDGVPVGFVSGYIRPDAPDTLFIWQVAVAPEARGMSLGKRMMLDILSRDACDGVTTLHTTITSSNKASQAIFQSLANALDTSAAQQSGFDRDRHLAGSHPSETLWVIGPFDRFALRDRRKAA